jgi:hypothetical protein
MTITVAEIKKWLEEEIKFNSPVLNGDEEMTDGTEDIIEGRTELAESLLDYIKERESKR